MQPLHSWKTYGLISFLFPSSNGNCRLSFTTMINHVAHLERRHATYSKSDYVFRTEGYQIQTRRQRQTNAFHKCYNYSPFAVFLPPVWRQLQS